MAVILLQDGQPPIKGLASMECQSKTYFNSRYCFTHTVDLHGGMHIPSSEFQQQFDVWRAMRGYYK